MSSIRLSGTSSGYYDLTVPAAAGTNSIDLSALPVKDSNGNLGIGTLSPSASHRLTLDKTSNYGGISFNQNGNQVGQIIQEGGTGNIYIDADSNSIGGGLIFRTTGGTTRMTISTAGHVTTPNVPAFHCASSSSSLSTGAFILGSTDKSQSISAVINNGNHYNTGNGRFTAPVAGFYFFSAMASPSQGANSGIYIEKNGSQVSGAAYVYGVSYNGSSVSAVVQLAVGDYAVGVHVPFNSTSESQYSGSFTGFLIG